MRIPLFHVDAFTNRPFAGNPAAVCLLDEWLDDDFLRKVAAENNLSETAYLVPRGERYELRWFTPRCEVNLCGHATLASAQIVLNKLKPVLDVVQFQTRSSGILTVSRDGDRLSMDFPSMPPTSCVAPPDELIRSLGPGPLPSDLLEANETYIAVYENESVIRKLRPDLAGLERLHPFCVSVTAPGDAADFVSRYFAPSYGIPEDPVTGSANCFLAPYWTERLGKKQLHAQQVSERGGEIWCEVSGDRVIIKGNAVLTMEASLLV